MATQPKYHIQADIFALFLTAPALRFKDIAAKIDLRTNLLSYHLERLIAQGKLIKDDDVYRVAKDAESLLPKSSVQARSEQYPLTIVVVAIQQGKKICLLQRTKRPYQKYWGMIGGKLRLAESIADAAVREAREEAGLLCTFDRVAAVLHERVDDAGLIKHGFVIFLCVVRATDTVLKASDEGQVAWYSLTKLPQNIIPSDALMIRQFLEKTASVQNIILTEKDEHIINCEVTDL